jgi:hypothetical protein
MRRFLRRLFHPKIINELAEDIENGRVPLKNILNPQYVEEQIAAKYELCVHYQGTWRGKIVNIRGNYDYDGAFTYGLVYIGEAEFGDYNVIMAAIRRNRIRENEAKKTQAIAACKCHE